MSAKGKLYIQTYICIYIYELLSTKFDNQRKGYAIVANFCGDKLLSHILRGVRFRIPKSLGIPKMISPRLEFGIVLVVVL